MSSVITSPVISSRHKRQSSSKQEVAALNSTQVEFLLFLYFSISVVDVHKYAFLGFSVKLSLPKKTNHRHFAS